jgi:uncharacterized protein YbjT (DUF2867 family)
MSTAPSKTRRVVVAGATGLVGTEVTKLLAERPGVETVVLVRSAKPGRFPANVTERVFDYDSDASYAELTSGAPDAILCCLGTTRGKAGSDEAFRKVDAEYPKRLVEVARKSASRCTFGLVSSVGAGSPRGLYLNTKADAERAVVESGLPFAIVRPSFLTGDRTETRIGEKVGLFTIGPILSGLGAISNSMKRYAPIEARDVARALIRLALDQGDSKVAEGKELFDAARG